MRATYALVLLLAFSSANPIGARAQARWQLSESPTLVIGSVAGLATSVFHDIRGVVAATDSLIAIADGGSREVRIFSMTGEFVTSFGRLGDGPKEFRGIGWIDMCGGAAVVVYDLLRYRVTKWDTRGNLLDDFGVEGTGGGLPPYSVSCGPSGTFAVVGWPDIGGRGAEVGPYRPDVLIGIADRRGRLDRVLGTFPGHDRYRYPTNDGPQRFGRSTIARMGANAVYVGTADSFNIEIIEPDGGRHGFGKRSPVTRLTSRMKEAWGDSLIKERAPDRRPATRAALREYVFPDRLPAYSDFLLDRLGFVWVAPYGIPGQQAADWTEWDVFSADGTLVAAVRIPNHFRPTEIGRDYVLGVGTDTMDVEQARMYRLTR